MDAKARAAASIAEAKEELDRALAAIDTIEVYDPTLVGMVAHAIGNYNRVTASVVELLQGTLRDYPDPDVAVWLDGLRHAAELTQHSVARLVSAAGPRDFPLKFEHVNVSLLMSRAGEFYSRRADIVRVGIMCESAGEVPPAWGDRVAVAVIADNLLSHALRRSEPNTMIRIRITEESGHVVCRVCRAGIDAAAQERRVLQWPTTDDNLPPREEDDVRLTVATEFARRMNGDVWREPQPAGDVCVAFRLPASVVGSGTTNDET